MTAKQKVGWKVLSDSVERKSCVVYNTPAERHYLKRKKIIPVKGYGPLYVFTCKYSAYNFIIKKDVCNDSVQGRIVKCLYKPSKIKWIRKSVTSSIPLIGLPTGTALADSVTCLE